MSLPTTSPEESGALRWGQRSVSTATVPSSARKITRGSLQIVRASGFAPSSVEVAAVYHWLRGISWPLPKSLMRTRLFPSHSFCPRKQRTSWLTAIDMVRHAMTPPTYSAADTTRTQDPTDHVSTAHRQDYQGARGARQGDPDQLRRWTARLRHPRHCGGG